ncbi:Uncharacterized protein HZ326_16526 [Fusarium oxysporum f. sp. albedinis]|nr:Uncharacterized protein HZ326_16526 [Fusarium oxysporum f. sp. albedinis]
MILKAPEFVLLLFATSSLFLATSGNLGLTLEADVVSIWLNRVYQHIKGDLDILPYQMTTLCNVKTGLLTTQKVQTSCDKQAVISMLWISQVTWLA